MRRRQFGRFGPLVAALEQPTRAARATVFAAKNSEMLTYHQIPIATYHPENGWVEQDPIEILDAILECMEVALDNLRKLDINPEDIVSVGLSNQRETVIVWDVKSGYPLNNAIVWMDTRSIDIVDNLSKVGNKTLDSIRTTCGLPLSTVFSAPKLKWLLDNNQNVKSALSEGTCRAGTVDSWLIWNLTGGNKGGVHVTDVTNASRTMLMNLTTHDWDKHLCDFFEIPQHILPVIKSSSEIYGYIFIGSLTGIPISGCLGDQQASLVGQMCLEYGQSKCTFGTGTFVLCNTGTSLIRSNNGLLTTVAYKFGPKAKTVYALEGSGILAGITMDWLKNGIEIIDSNENLKNNDYDKTFKVDLEPESLKASLLKKLSDKIKDQDPDEDGTVYFVPAFTGLLSPQWRRDARGVICGLSPNTHFSHIIVGASRAIAFQTRAILESISRDCGRHIKRLLVDGTLAMNTSLMQVQADICGIPIVRPIMAESSALGAAIAAGSASEIDVWPKSSLPPPSDTFFPTTNEDERDIMYSRWKMAVERSEGWSPKKLPSHEVKNECDIMKYRMYSSIPSGLFLLSSFLIMLLADKLKS